VTRPLTKGLVFDDRISVKVTIGKFVLTFNLIKIAKQNLFSMFSPFGVVKSSRFHVETIGVYKALKLK